jgi:PAS domain S-box-containing protein
MELRDMEVLAWRLFEESNDAIFLLNAETELIWQANPAAQRLTGMRWRQLRDRRLDELVLSDHDGQMLRLLTAVNETGFFHSQEEYLLCRNEQDPLPVNISVSRVQMRSDNIGVVVARDISERKRAETALREFSDELEKQVLVQTEQLRAVNRKLSSEIEERKGLQQSLQDTNQKLREAISQLEHAQEQAIHRERASAFEQIAGGVAHDINNSLSSVTAYSELLLRTELDDQNRQWALGIRTSTRDIASTVRRLRQFYGDSQDQGAQDEIDLEELAQEVMQLTRPKWYDESLLRGKDIVMSAQALTQPTIVGDTSALRSVLTNLIFNAVDAVKSAGQIDLRISEQNTMAVVEVIDNGEGMTADGRGRCLEPFYTTKAAGTGLGLSVCRGIVKSHGGVIEIDSTLGEGTTVRLLIPKPKNNPLSGPTDIEPAAIEAVASGLHGKRILYVDDDCAARASTEALLNSLGMVVDTAKDGHHGLQAFRRAQHELVLTDMSMPGMDGLQLTAEIKNLEPTTPVVVLSGWFAIDSQREPKSVQPDRVLGKPISYVELTDTLVHLLNSNAAANPGQI